MDRSLYIAMSGAKQMLQAQTANSNNLANANTTGFRADLDQFRSMPVFGPGHPTRVFSMEENPGFDYTPGVIQTTGRGLDVALKGEGWIAVQAPDGSEAYTRDGRLNISADGLLQTAEGLNVMGNAGPIALPPSSNIAIGVDGTISLIADGDNAANLAVLEQIKLVNPDRQNLEKGDDGLVHTRDGAPLEASADVSVVSGALEGSNVNTIDAMVSMIDLARQYELQVKMMKTVDENEASSSQLLNMG